MGFFPGVITRGECRPAQRAEAAWTSCAAHQPSRAGAWQGPSSPSQHSLKALSGKRSRSAVEGRAVVVPVFLSVLLHMVCAQQPSPGSQDALPLPQDWTLSGGWRISTSAYLLISVKAQAFVCRNRSVKFAWKVWRSPFIRVLAHVVGFETQVPKPLLLPGILNSLWA